MPTLQAEQSRLITISLVVLAAIALAAALAATRAVMVPFVLAIFISYLVLPLIDYLQSRLRFPRAVALIVALLAALGVLTLLGLLITESTRELLASIPVYRDRLAGTAERVLSILDRFSVDLGQDQLLEGIRQLPLLSLVRSTAGTVVDLVTTGGLVLIFVVYLVIGRRPSRQLGGIYAEVNSKVQRYIVTKFLISATTGLLVGTILWLFGLDLALMFGVMAFLLNFIPSIGSVVATLLPIPFAIIQFDSTWAIVGVVALPGLIQLVIGNGIEPLVMGERLDLHPVTVLLSLIFWGLLWGIVGMFLAVPITAVIRIVLGRIETTRPFAELLAGRLPQAAEKPV
ncbi:MAG: AI-2E family transporter [Gemmatimonadota bacterium]|nr:MAG: AI-2E family transporter [Gemmatimonadota bacterium]